MFRRFSVLFVPAVLMFTSLPGLAGQRDEPDMITVQHLLIGFKRTLAKKGVTRSKKEAQALADELLRRAGDGEDFDALVKQYTDDSYPGIYKLTNRKAPLRSDARRRDEMVAAFGDVAFSLEPGEIRMAKYSAHASPYGWHIIKRLE